MSLKTKLILLIFSAICLVWGIKNIKKYVKLHKIFCLFSGLSGILIGLTGIILVYFLPIEYICKYGTLFIILGSIGGFIFGLSVFFYFTFERYEQKKFDWKSGIEGLSGGLFLIWLNRNKNFIISLPYWVMFIFPLTVGGLFHLFGWTFNKLKNKKDREL